MFDTIFLALFGVDLYRLGFNLLSFWGLTITYLYFQIPLMVLIVTPALDGLKREWREAAETLGARPWRVFFTVTLPLALPGVLAGMVLGFAKAIGEFGATITFVSNIPGETQTIS